MAKAKMKMKLKKGAKAPMMSAPMKPDTDADGYKKGGMVKSKSGKGAC